MIWKLDGRAKRCDLRADLPRWAVEINSKHYYIPYNKVDHSERNRTMGHFCDYSGSLVTFNFDSESKQISNVSFDVPPREPCYEISTVTWKLAGKKWGVATRNDCGCRIGVNESRILTEGPFEVGVELYHSSHIFNGKVEACNVEVCVPR